MNNLDTLINEKRANFVAYIKSSVSGSCELGDLEILGSIQLDVFKQYIRDYIQPEANICYKSLLTNTALKYNNGVNLPDDVEHKIKRYLDFFGKSCAK